MIDKACKQCSQKFVITDGDLAFYKKISPSFAGKTYEVPPPTLCPDCRLQRRLIFRHGGQFYKSKCDLSGADIVSMYAPNSKFKVYEQDAWWSDKWDPMEYGRDFDSLQTFTEQFNELLHDVPHAALVNTNSENSYFCNHGINQKNCYLITGATDNEAVLYGYFITKSRNSMDGLSISGCDFCYEGIASFTCNNCKFFYNCRDCADCFMIGDCQGCNNCIGCFGLRRKNYHVFNKDIGKEGYEKFVKENLEPITRKKIDEIRGKYDELRLGLPHVQSHLYNCEESTGDMLFNSKNSKSTFSSSDCEDCKYIAFAPKSKDAYDGCFGAPYGQHFSYENASSVQINNSLSNYLLWFGNNVYYSYECHHCDDLFGCVGLRHKQYCIFNKQFSEDDYEAEVAKIITKMQETQEWGEYFDKSLSPFAYNETAADDYLPLDQGAATKAGFSWSDYKPPRPQAAKVAKASELPEDIAQVTDDILKTAIECEITDRLFVVTEQELALYRYLKLPLPKRHPDQRHKDRLKIRAPIKLWQRTCAKCDEEIQTVFAPSRPETIYCEKCYQQSVI